MRLVFRRLLACAALFPLASGLAGCGKGPNVGVRNFLQFAHGLPEAPRPLALRDALRPGAVGAALAVVGDALVVADAIGHQLVVLARADLSVRETVALGGRPEAVVALPSGGLWVSLRGAGTEGDRGGELVRLNAGFAIAERLPLGRDVHGLALSSSGTTLWATLPLDGDVVTLREQRGAWEEVARTSVGLLPRGVAAAPTGLVVALQHGQVARLELDADGLPVAGMSPFTASLRVGNPPEFRRDDGTVDPFRVRLTQPTRALAVAVNPESGQAYVAHVIAAPGNSAALVDAAINAGLDADPSATASGYGDGSGMQNVSGRSFALPARPLEATVSVVDPSTGAVAPAEGGLTVRDPGTGNPMTQLVDQPSALAHHPTHSLLLMAGEGSDNVLVLSTAEGDPMRSPVAAVDVGAAPRAIAIAPDGETAYVLSAHDFAVQAVDLRPLLAMPTTAQREVLPERATDGGSVMAMAPQALPPEGEAPRPTMPEAVAEPTPDSLRVEPVRLEVARRVVFGTDPRPASVARGARLFTAATDARISHAGQFACASCHYEGLEDGVAWVTPDGVRQTIALAGRLAGTGPFNWNGSEDALSTNMNKTIARMGGDGLVDAELSDLEAFLLAGLPPLPASRAALTPVEQLGKALFEDPEVGCASCHRPSSAFTDGLAHDVGSLSGVELAAFEQRKLFDPSAELPRFNTPSLSGLAWTAPYLHDGSAATLEQMLWQTGDKMGQTSHLTPEELDALVAYLQTL
jgi:DNA-binding beta-propeller fold protein YncE